VARTGVALRDDGRAAVFRSRGADRPAARGAGRFARFDDGRPDPLRRKRFTPSPKSLAGKGFATPDPPDRPSRPS